MWPSMLSRIEIGSCVIEGVNMRTQPGSLFFVSSRPVVSRPSDCGVLLLAETKSQARQSKAIMRISGSGQAFSFPMAGDQPGEPDPLPGSHRSTPLCCRSPSPKKAVWCANASPAGQFRSWHADRACVQKVHNPSSLRSDCTRRVTSTHRSRTVAVPGMPMSRHGSCSAAFLTTDH